MRFAIVVKANAASEAGVLPGEESLREVVEYLEELQKPRVLYDAIGLRPTREGWRVRYSADGRTVVNGPFVDAADQVAGWAIIQVSSREEAMGWALRFPWPTPDRDIGGEVEVRQVFELDEFAQGDHAVPRTRIDRPDRPRRGTRARGTHLRAWARWRPRRAGVAHSEMGRSDDRDGDRRMLGRGGGYPSLSGIL